MAKKYTNPNIEGSPVTATPKRGISLDYSSPNSLTKSQSIVDANRMSSPDAITQSPFDNDYFNPKFLGFSLGEVDNSAFNTGSFNNPFNENIDFERIRAEKQSSISKLGSTGVQFLGKTGVGIVGNIVGSFYGIGSAIAEGDITQTWDNSVFRSLDEANEAIEAKNTVFLNRKKGLGLNMELFKDVTDAFSFIASAVGAELIMQTAGNVAGGAGITSLSGRMARYLTGASKLAKQLDNVQDLERLALELGTTVDKLSKVKRNLDMIKGGTEMGRKILTTTGYEASLEARQTKDEMINGMEARVDSYLKTRDDLTDAEKLDYKANFMTKAERDADKAGMLTFGLNTALLSASNIMQFPSVFGSSYLKAKKLYDLERTGLGAVAKAKVGNKFVRGASTIGRTLKNPLTEFTEETMQKAFSESSRNYYEDILATETKGEVLMPAGQSYADSMWHGLKEAYGTEEGLHEGFIGAIVGAIGLPGFKKVAGKTKLNWQGGVPGDIKEIREKKNYTESAINTLNGIKMSEAVNYKKDNAILATLDADKEDAALVKGSKIEFDNVQDNKVFRYVTDRMKKGVGEFIDEDIKEMTSMDLDTYKKNFGKDEHFKQEEKDKEIEDFSKKVDIYKDAFKVTHKTLDVLGYHYDNLVHNKLTDILTHSIATQKIKGEQLEKAKQSLFQSGMTDFTPEELNQLATTSGKIRNANQLIDDYIAQKTKENNQRPAKENNSRSDIQNQIKSNLDGNYTYLLDLDKSILVDQKNALESVIDPSEGIKNQLDNINKALELKDEYNKTLDKKFDASKSSKIRNDLKTVEQLTKEINDKITKSAGLAMEQLGVMPAKVTTDELAKYLETKDKITNHLKDKNDSTYILDQPEATEDQQDLLKTIQELTYEFTIATQVAGSLYGIKSSPERMYSNIMASELFANVDNVKNKILNLEFQRMTNVPINQLKPLIDELETNLETIKDQFAKIKDVLNKKSIETVENTLKFGEQALSNFQEYLKTKKVVEKQKKDNKKAIADNGDGEFDFGELGKAGVLRDGTEEDTDSEEGSVGKVLDKKFNRLSINELREDGTPQLSNPGFPTLEEAIAKGLIKNKAATTLTYLEDKVDPETNEYLKRLLIDNKALSAYDRGRDKVEKDKSVLDNIYADKDVFTFVRFVPMHVNVYDKVAEKVDNHYEFEITEEDNIVYQQFLYAPDDMLAKAEELANEQDAYDKEVAALNEWKKEESKKKKPRVNLANEYKDALKQLEDKYFSKSRGSYSNLDMRKELLLSDSNELKLKVHNVDQGDFENFEDAAKRGTVEENNVSELGYDASTMDINDLMYTNTNGNYIRIDGVPVESIDNYRGDQPHPAKEMGEGNSALLYFNHEDKSGRIVPIKMNMATISPKDVNLIFKVFEDYITTSNRGEYKVNITTKEHAILGKEKNLSMEDFLSFFLKTKKNNAFSPLFVHNTFNLNSEGLKDGKIAFQVLTKGFENLELVFPPADGDNDAEILNIFNENKEALREILLKQRHNFNKRFFTKGEVGNKELDRDNLDYMFKEGIINHSFNVNNNFDKIYAPNYNKKVVISRADIDDAASDRLKKPTISSMLYDLRIGLTNKSGEKNYEGNLTDMYNAIMSSIRTSITFKKKKDNMTVKEKEALIVDSINTILDKRIEEVKETGSKAPGSIFTPTLNHEKNTKIHPDDKILDQALKTLYQFKNVAFAQKEFVKEIRLQMDHWNTLSLFLDKFKHPPSGVVFPMLNFVPNSDGTEIRTSIENEKQLESFMRMINVLKELTDANIDINLNYSETYPNAIKNDGSFRKFNWRYRDPKNLKESQLTNEHHKTRLKSIQIEEEPRWENGELVAGEIYFNFGTKPKGSKKIGNQKVLALSADKSISKSTNIMTSISLPFISTTTFELSPVFDTMLNEIQDKLGQSLAAKNIALSKFIITKQRPLKSNELYNDENEDDNGEFDFSQLEKEGLIDTSKDTNVDIKAKIADIERRRQEELRQNLSKTDFATSLFPALSQSNMSQGGGAYVEINFGKNNVFKLDTYLTPSSINGQYVSIKDGKAQVHGEMSDGTKISLPWNQLKDLLNSIKAVNVKGEIVYEFNKVKINAKYDAELTGLNKKTKTTVVKSTKTLDPKTLNSETSTTLFKTIIPIFAKRLSDPNKELTDKNKETVINNLKERGITNLTEYLFALKHYNSKEIIDYSEENIVLGETIFNESRNECK